MKRKKWQPKGLSPSRQCPLMSTSWVSEGAQVNEETLCCWSQNKTQNHSFHLLPNSSLHMGCPAGSHTHHTQGNAVSVPGNLGAASGWHSLLLNLSSSCLHHPLPSQSFACHPPVLRGTAGFSPPCNPLTWPLLNTHCAAEALLGTTQNTDNRRYILCLLEIYGSLGGGRGWGSGAGWGSIREGKNHLILQSILTLPSLCAKNHTGGMEKRKQTTAKPQENGDGHGGALGRDTDPRQKARCPAITQVFPCQSSAVDSLTKK